MATTQRRYAQGTTVEVHKSRGEISGILTTHGVDRQGWMTGPDGDELMFELSGHKFRFTIPKPTMAEVAKLYPNAYDRQAKLDGEWRRRWRANVLLLKAKLEFIDSGDTTLERELLPYLVTAGGKTLGELVVAGELPMLTGGKR